MRVRFYATLRPLVGGPSAEIPLPENPTVQNLVDAMVRAFPELADAVLDSNGQLSRRVHVMVGGRSAIYLEDGLETRLSPDDSVEVFPAVAGG